MRDLNKIGSQVMWVKNPIVPQLDSFMGIRTALIDLPTGVRASLVIGTNEFGWEHVSIELYARRLPTWEEMCFIKELFWEDDEEVVQIHPRKDDYVSETEALHLWRPANGDWTLMDKR